MVLRDCREFRYEWQTVSFQVFVFVCMYIIRVTLFALVIVAWSIFTIFLLHWINKLALFDRALPFTVVYIIEPWERLPSLARRRSDFNRFSLWVWLIDGFIRILSRHSMSSRALWEDLQKIWKVRNFWIFCGCKFWFWFVMDKKVSINYFVREFNI